MSMTKFGDLVVAISTGSGPKIYKKVGVMMKADEGHNDNTKGPGFLLLLDKTFNPAGVPDGSPTSIPVSVYWPEERRAKPQNPPRPTGDFDDGIPF